MGRKAALPLGLPVEGVTASTDAFCADDGVCCYPHGTVKGVLERSSPRKPHVALISRHNCSKGQLLPSSPAWLGQVLNVL